MDLAVTGKVVLITGGSAGLGLALSRQLLDEGARVALCGRNPDRLVAVRTELSVHSGRCLVVRADVRSADDIRAFVDAAEPPVGGIAARVNKAGTAGGGRFETSDDDYWAADLESKLMAAVRASRLVIPKLRARGAERSSTRCRSGRGCRWRAARRARSAARPG
jgi:NAD(P)-dependent dehydrogenase (short-subunit alcohol dehydrogenase family)